MVMDPGKALRKKFDLTVQVLEYKRGRFLHLKVLSDSSGRLTQVFDRIEWTVEIQPKPNGGSLIRGTAVAHTCHWRSRLFGKLTERIVMNQVFYPNLMKLSELKQPFSADSALDSKYSPWK